MSTQLQVDKLTEEPSTFIQMEIEFMDLVYYYNEADSETDQTKVKNELDLLVGKIAQKFDNTVYVIRNLDSQAEYFKKLANSILEKARVAYPCWQFSHSIRI
jgi:hypothetical protein